MKKVSTSTSSLRFILLMMEFLLYVDSELSYALSRSSILSSRLSVYLYVM